MEGSGSIERPNKTIVYLKVMNIIRSVATIIAFAIAASNYFVYCEDFTMEQKSRMADPVAAVSERRSGEESVISAEAVEEFEGIWRTISADERRQDFAVPSKIIWLTGAPGAGKGTNSGHIQHIFSIGQQPIVTSDLLASEEFQAIKDSGRLVSDRDVTLLLFRRLFTKRYADGAIVDGYPRTRVQSECVKLLNQRLADLGFQSHFRFVALKVSESVSIGRQLGRGQRAMQHNRQVKRSGRGAMVPIRKTDIDPDAAAIRYGEFVQNTDATFGVLQDAFPCIVIDAEGSFDEVRRRLYGSLR